MLMLLRSSGTYTSLPSFLKFDLFRAKVAEKNIDPAQSEPALWGDYNGGSGSDICVGTSMLPHSSPFSLSLSLFLCILSSLDSRRLFIGVT